jgi:hypothetical protein
MVYLDLAEHECEREFTSFIVYGLDLDGPSKLFNDLLTNVQAESNALGVNSLGRFQESEEFEQLRQVFSLDPNSLVFYHHFDSTVRP